MTEHCITVTLTTHCLHVQHSLLFTNSKIAKYFKGKLNTRNQYNYKWQVWLTECNTDQATSNWIGSVRERTLPSRLLFRIKRMKHHQNITSLLYNLGYYGVIKIFRISKLSQYSVNIALEISFITLEFGKVSLPSWRRTKKIGRKIKCEMLYWTSDVLITLPCATVELLFVWAS